MSTLVTVSTHTNHIEAHILRCRLEAEDIPAFIASEHHVRMNWLMSYALGGVRVQVPAQFAPRALSVIRDVESGSYELPDEADDVPECPRCGSHQNSLDRRSWRMAFLSFFVLSVPIPFDASALKCGSCGFRGSEKKFRRRRLA